ncbi:MAG: hypothetical protein K1060chlam4_00179 [Candidatus Anoxychlamydiales bacterium]|nr:hypothetical protein [Candidatus Anoxychlamydiales bacterium]
MSSSPVSSSASSLGRLDLGDKEEDDGLTSNDYSQDVSPLYSTEKNGGIWRVMALNPEKIVSASYDHLAKIWTPKEGAEGTELTNIKVLKGHEREVLSLARLSEKLFLTGSSDSKICFWNTEDGSLEGFFKDEKNPTGFYSMEVIDSNTIATGSCQKPEKHHGTWRHVIKIWDVSKKQFKFKLNGHTGGISEIVNLDGKLIATSSGDHTIRIWDLLDKSTCSIFQQHSDYVYGLAKLDNTTLVSASKDRTMRLFDVEAEKEIGAFSHTDDKKAHSSSIYDVNSLGENVVASASRDGYVKIWDARTLTCIKMLDADDGYVYSVNFSPDGKIFAGTAGKRDPKISKKEKKSNANIVGWDFRRI